MEKVRMSADGFASVTVDYNDITNGEYLDTLKKIRISSNESTAGGLVAIATGTAGTTAVTLDLFSLGYTDSNGDAVTFSSEAYIDGVAFAADPHGTVSICPSSGAIATQGGRSFKMGSVDNSVAVSKIPGSGFTVGGLDVRIVSEASPVSTITYTVVVWGRSE
jgi:hypothetical protein